MEQGKGSFTPKSTLLTTEILEALSEYRQHKQDAEQCERLARIALDKAMSSFDELTFSSEEAKL